MRIKILNTQNEKEINKVLKKLEVNRSVKKIEFIKNKTIIHSYLDINGEKEEDFKFDIGEIVEHKISKEKFVIIKRDYRFFSNRIYYMCSKGKIDYRDEMGYINLDEGELKGEGIKK